MPIEIPAAPAGVTTLLALLAPYLIAVINQPRWSTNAKRLVAVAASLVLTLVSLAIYYAMTGDTVPQLPALLLLGLSVSQMSHGLLTRKSADSLEQATSRPPA